MITYKKSNNILVLTNFLIPLLPLKVILALNKEEINLETPIVNSHYLWSTIKEVRIFPSSGNIMIDLQNGQNGKQINIYQSFNGIKPDIYQQFIADLHIFFNTNSLSHLVKFKSGIIDAEKLGYLDADCDYCHNDMKWQEPNKEHSNDPYLVECNLCHKKSLSVFCDKCSIGGLIVPEVSATSLGAVTDFSAKPIYWQCNNCENKWPINQQIYDKPVLAQSLLQPEHQEKIKESIKTNPQSILKAKQPNLLFIFLINFIASFITSIISTLYCFWVIFFGNLNRRTKVKIVGIIILANILSYIAKKVLFN